MYDKDEVNAIAMLYAVEQRKEDFDLLLKALDPMINVVVKRYPEYAEHFEDIKQSVFLSLIKNVRLDAKERSNREDLEKGFSHKLPSTFFFYKIRVYTLMAISILDTSKPMSSGKLREHHLSMVYDGSPESRPCSNQLLQRQEMHHTQPFGVERPAPPHVTIGHYPAKRRMGPLARIGGHDVYVMVQHQRLEWFDAARYRRLAAPDAA